MDDISGTSDKISAGEAGEVAELILNAQCYNRIVNDNDIRFKADLDASEIPSPRKRRRS